PTRHGCAATPNAATTFASTTGRSASDARYSNHRSERARMTRRRSGAGSGSGRHTRPRGARAQRSHAAGAIDGWWDAPPRLLVTTADEARAADRHAIEADGVPSRALMQRAGAAAAARIISQVADRLE